MAIPDSERAPTAALPPRNEQGALLCSYCRQPAVLRETSTHLFDRDRGPVWECEPCGAWTLCSEGTISPRGRLANGMLRDTLKEAHGLFERLCQKKAQRDGCDLKAARRAGKRWLAGQLGIDTKLCDFSLFNLGMARRVEDVCSAVLNKSKRY